MSVVVPVACYLSVCLISNVLRNKPTVCLGIAAGFRLFFDVLTSIVSFYTGPQSRGGVAYGVTSLQANRNTVTKAGRCYVNNKMAEYLGYHNGNSSAHIKAQMSSSEIPAS
jgi:multimeric flavodoxin WrbA